MCAGCYECSQRRIHCDRVQPCCGKCASRGIPCSGLGVRYRFRDGGSQGKIAWQEENSPQGGYVFPLMMVSPKVTILNGRAANGRVISRSINAHRPLSVVALPRSNMTGPAMSQMTPQNPMH
ncbi:hypothetical protein BDV41DRAFT_242477 [Aspergillus transmontanensis]|uniref:Zn(2)-C6 fungal-type domain-containing protein n=1 Tax=Aspergillus transmontanensis TaxID=1034304 RepID=A0A5N6VZN9_9EURO|nr:hypothetical protein BDV41DRAFT_242477 [Aspergillus transmontanensis]